MGDLFERKITTGCIKVKDLSFMHNMGIKCDVIDGRLKFVLYCGNAECIADNLHDVLYKPAFDGKSLIDMGREFDLEPIIKDKVIKFENLNEWKVARWV